MRMITRRIMKAVNPQIATVKNLKEKLKNKLLLVSRQAALVLTVSELLFLNIHRKNSTTVR